MAPTPSPTIAYYTVVDDAITGWTGGLLLLNQGGRPIEFQCTLPLRPSRAHEILYGETLRPHLIGEVIGPLLAKKCRAPISLLCCDQLEAIAVAANVSFPVTIVREAANETERNGDRVQTGDRVETGTQSAHRTTSKAPGSDGGLEHATTVLLAGSRLLVRDDQVEIVRALARQLSDLPDAVEPFERIREAIKEAQSQIARTAASRQQAA